ncbi:hypothetical protein DKX38_029582 [Salix brachista]|uniref:DUF1232 domain-containing protein n=1 Tax=Salix brachista TaxID=2182728 RepID=A0A5N5J3W4_9ROSI|nr:hypothetical protein DKX38_029582 [Salix brachista]
MDGPPVNDCCSICHGHFKIACQANCSHWFCGQFVLHFLIYTHAFFLSSGFFLNYLKNKNPMRVFSFYNKEEDFDGDCIMLVWHHGSVLQPCKCPLCRRQITLLVPGEASLRERSDPDVTEVIGKIERYNHLFGGNSSGLIQASLEKEYEKRNSCFTLWPRMQDLPFLLRRLLQEIMDPQRSLPLVIRARVYISVILSAIYIISPVDIIPEGLLGIVGLLDDLLVVLICFLHVAAIYRALLYYRHGGS